MKKLQSALVCFIALLVSVIVVSLATATGKPLPKAKTSASASGSPTRQEFNVLKSRVLNLEERAPVPGPRGPAGPQGPPGPQGPTGPAGGTEQPRAEAPAPEAPPAEHEEVPATTPAGQVIFSDDFNSIPAAHSSAGGWYLQCDSGRASVVNGVARFEVRPTDIETDTGSPRCELSNGGPELHAGDDVWVYDKFRWGAEDTATPPWELIDQWHDGGSTGGQFSPPIALFRYGQNIRLSNGNGSPVYWQGPTVQRGAWQELIYHLQPSPTNGHLEAWWNGQKVADFTGKLMNTSSLYLKIGINRSKDTSGGGTSVVEHDRLVIATTKAAATAQP